MLYCWLPNVDWSIGITMWQLPCHLFLRTWQSHQNVSSGQMPTWQMLFVSDEWSKLRRWTLMFRQRQMPRTFSCLRHNILLTTKLLSCFRPLIILSCYAPPSLGVTLCFGPIFLQQMSRGRHSLQWYFRLRIKNERLRQLKKIQAVDNVVKVKAKVNDFVLP